MEAFAIGLVLAAAIGVRFCGLFMGRPSNRQPQWNKRSKKFV